MMRQISLRAKLLFPIVIGLICFLLFFNSYWDKLFWENERKAFHHNAHDLLISMEADIIRNLLASDYAALFESLDMQSSNHTEHVRMFRVTNREGKVVYPLFYKEDASQITDPSNQYWVTRDLYVLGEQAGKLSALVDFTQTYVEKNAYVTAIKQFIYFMIILVAVFSYIWQNKVIVRPISELEKAVQRISSGDYNVELSATGRQDEIGVLARSFDSMSRDIRMAQGLLEEALQNVKEQEKKQRTLVEHMGEALLTIRPNGTLESYNYAAERIFEISRSQNIAYHIADFIDLQGQSIDMWYTRSEQMSNNTGEMWLEVTGRRGRACFSGEMSITRINNRNETLYICLFRDITERKKIDKMKSEFVATISHELRTPITSVIGSIKLLNQGVVGELPGQAMEVLTLAERNANRLLKLINELLDMEKISSGALSVNLTEINISALLAEIAEENSGYAAQFGVTLTLDVADQYQCIYADKDRLAQAISNLVSNAIKFSPRDATVTLACESEGAITTIKVIDQGPGIPESDRERIFEKFTQLDSSDSRRSGGTGLGLNIARTIVEKHNGVLTFNSKEGEGTTFLIHLPVYVSRRVSGSSH